MKLFVAGCSFSDYSNVSYTYGEKLATKLGVEYVHEASGCGSNERIWRVLTNHIRDDYLTSNDLLIVQYTTIERKEFWSHFEGTDSVPKTINLNEKYKHGGSLIKFKYGCGSWLKHNQEKTFCNQFEKYFLSIDYEKEKFSNQNLMFQSLLHLKKIPTVFLTTSYIGKNEPSSNYFSFKNSSLPDYLDTSFNWFKNETQKETQLTPDIDYLHLSEFGHQVLAEDLFTFIKEKGII